MVFASRLGAARSPRRATLILNGMYSATLDMIFSTLIHALRMSLPQSASLSSRRQFTIEPDMILNHGIAIEVLQSAGPRC